MSEQKFTWNKQREKAAKLVAEDKLTDEEIAAIVGITRTGLFKWRSHPDFKARVAEIVEAYRQAILNKGIADRVNRVEALNDRWYRMREVIEARASAMPDDAPGSDTGLLVHQVKMIGQGQRAIQVDEYAVDTGLLRELREHEKQAAQELGQWTEKRELTGKGGGPIEILDARERLSSKLDGIAARRAAQSTDSESVG